MNLSVLVFGAVILGPFVVRAQCPTECKCEDSELGPTTKAICSKLRLSDVIPRGKHGSFKILDISFNEIQILKKRTFENNSLLELTNLNASHNVLEEIDDEAFHLMVDLKVLDLSHNNLSSLRPSAFNPFRNSLEELNLNGNPFLVLSQGFSFPSIKTMDVSDCRLRSLPNKFFEHLATITHLNLEANDLERFDNLADVSKLKKLKWLNLRRNQMREMERDLVLLDDQVFIDLAGNPWMCNCDFLNDKFYTYQERAFSPELTCGGPEDIQGRVVSNSLANARCNVVVPPATELISVANVLVPIIIVGTTFVIILAILIFERRWRCFDCAGNRYEGKMKKLELKT